MNEMKKWENVKIYIKTSIKDSSYYMIDSAFFFPPFHHPPTKYHTHHIKDMLQPWLLMAILYLYLTFFTQSKIEILITNLIEKGTSSKYNLACTYVVLFRNCSKHSQDLAHYCLHEAHFLVNRSSHFLLNQFKDVRHHVQLS